jgi:hypothetical protein
MEKQHPPTEFPPEESASAPDTSLAENLSSESATPAPITRPLRETVVASQPLASEAPSLLQEASDQAATRHPSTQQPRRTLTRRQVLIGAGIVVGVAAIGTGTTLAILSGSSSTGSAPSTSPSDTGPVATVGLPPVQTPVSEDTLQAWRTKLLTVQPSQRFQHQNGAGVVPLGVVEPTYPNPYNPYYIHLQGYVLGGALVAKNQFFLYLGLESLDGSQFVARVRVGPVDQTSKTFGLLVTQQSTDAIEGGPAEFPQVSMAPKAPYQALPALADHCIEFACIRQPLPANAGEAPQSMLAEVNQQATISDQFLRADYDAIHHAPLAQLPTSELAPIRHLIDASPITYHPASDAGRYPLVTQLILRHSDQLYSKLVSE